MELRVFARREAKAAEASRGCGAARRRGMDLVYNCVSIYASERWCRSEGRVGVEIIDVRYVGRSVWVGEALEIAYMIENGLYT
jgi:hypothetical protein